MTLFQFLLMVGRQIASGLPLVGNTFTNPEFAVDIASDPAKLHGAQQYWRARFGDLQGGGTPVFAPAPDWLRFAEQASLVNLADWVALRNTMRATNDYNTTVRSPTMRGRIIADLDSLVAEAEIARFVGRTSTPPVDDFSQSLLEATVYAFFHATAPPAAGSDEMTTIARGIRASRELHDAGQRFLFARESAGAFPGLSFAEALALHRAEGAFCMPPPDASKLHAPLVLTQPTLPKPPDASELAARTQSTFAICSAFLSSGQVSCRRSARCRRTTRRVTC